MLVSCVKSCHCLTATLPRIVKYCKVTDISSDVKKNSLLTSVVIQNKSCILFSNTSGLESRFLHQIDIAYLVNKSVPKANLCLPSNIVKYSKV